MGQYPPDEAKAVAATLLPNILPYDYARRSYQTAAGRLPTTPSIRH